MKATCLPLLFGLLLSGCATSKPNAPAPPPGPTLAEIQTMVDAHVSDSVIITKIQNSSSRYYLTADQIISLKNAGVSDAVINALIKTANKPEPRAEKTVYVYPYYGPGPWWGWGPYYYGGPYYYRGYPYWGWHGPHH
jgi:hypothetical protein